MMSPDSNITDDDGGEGWSDVGAEDNPAGVAEAAHEDDATATVTSAKNDSSAGAAPSKIDGCTNNNNDVHHTEEAAVGDAEDNIMNGQSGTVANGQDAPRPQSEIHAKSANDQPESLLQPEQKEVESSESSLVMAQTAATDKNDGIINNSTSDYPEQAPQDPEQENAVSKEDTTSTDMNSNAEIDPALQQHSMELNVALEALDSMRRANLEVEFMTATSSLPNNSNNASLTMQVNHERCTYCQREALHKLLTDPPKQSNSAIANGGDAGGQGITIGKVKLDGSRMRRFRSNVGSFFSKSAAAAPSSNTGNSNGDDSKSVATAQSCPPSLASQSQSMESIGEEDATNGNSIEANNKNRPSRRNILKKKHHPCLTCGHPTCPTHASSTFSKKHIPICQPCAYLFELDFLVDVISNTSSNMTECRRKVDDMVDCYDRAKLLLSYTAQYADEIASTLDTRTVRSNKLGAGSSATGIVSGVAGVVGCGALLFPPVAAAGVPLLIASLVFGGGATAVQTGDAAARYFGEPERLAEKMVALHGMVLSLLRITEVLSYGLLKSQLNVNYSVEGYEEGEREDNDGEDTQREALKKEINELLEKHGVATTRAGVGAMKNAVATGIVATEVAAAGGAAAVAGAEAAVSTTAVAGTASVVGRGSRYFGRVGTTAASSARFIPIAGGLLSAACVVVEGRELKRTLSRMSEGNPCEKAEQVRSIRDELIMLPDSSVIAAECRHVFEMAQKEKARKEAATLAERDNTIKPEDQKEALGGLEVKDVNQGDISDIIDVMETATRADAMAKST